MTPGSTWVAINRAGRQPAEAAGRKCVAPAPGLTTEAHVMPSKAATTTAPTRGSRKVGGPIRGSWCATSLPLPSGSGATLTRLRRASIGRTGQRSPVWRSLAGTGGLPPAAARAGVPRKLDASTIAMFPTIFHADRAARLRRANLIAISAEVVRNARAFRMLYARSNRIRRHHTHEQSDARFDRAVCGFPDPCRMRRRAGSSPFPVDRAGPLIALAMAFRVGRAH